MLQRKRTVTEMSDDDDDDGLFMQRVGPVTSIYGGTVRGESYSDDDDDAELASVESRPRRKRRGRPPKMRRPAHAASEGDVVDVDAYTGDGGGGGGGGRVTSVSVFADGEAAPSDEVVDIDAEVVVDEVSTAALRTQALAKMHLQNAQRGQHGRALEESIAAEAAREAAAKALVEERERARERERIALAEVERARERERIALAERARQREREQSALLERSKTAAAAATAVASAPTTSTPAPSPTTAASAAAAEEASGGADDGETVTLKLRYGDNKTVRMKTYGKRPLRLLLPAFCSKADIDAAYAVMEVDGEEVQPNETAETYDLEDGCIVEVRLRNKK